MYYRVSIKIGHLGAGKSHDIVRYIEAADLDTLLSGLKHFPGMKKKPQIEGISCIKTISREEFDAGRICEWKRACIETNLNEESADLTVTGQ